MPRTIEKILLSALMAAALFIAAGSSALAQSQIRYYRLAPKGIAETLTSIPGRKVLYIYAASSPVSRQNFSEMLALADHLHKEKIATFVAVSLDTNMKDLDRLLNIYAQIPFLPIVAVQTKSGELRLELSAIGIRYDNSLPFVAVIDEYNRVLLHGIQTPEDILEAAIPPEKQVPKKRTSVYDEEEQNPENDTGPPRQP